MPVCQKCEVMAATADMRRRKPPYEGKWLCKDKIACKRRVQQQNK